MIGTCSVKTKTHPLPRFKLVSHQSLDMNLKSEMWDLVCIRGVEHKHVKDLVCILYIVMYWCTQPNNK